MKMNNDTDFVLSWLAQMNDKKDACQRINSENINKYPELKQSADRDDQERTDWVIPVQSCGHAHRSSIPKIRINISSDSSLIEELIRPDHPYCSEKIEIKSPLGSLDGISLAQVSRVDSQTSSLLYNQKMQTPKRRSGEVFEKRLRYKTRESQFDKCKKHRDTSKTKARKTVKGRNGNQKSKFRIPEKLIHHSICKNNGPNRLTIRPSFKRGIFSNIKASSPTGRRGIPDLYFSEMEFVKNLSQVPQITEGERSVNNTFREKEKCDSLLAFSKSSPNPLEVSNSCQLELLVTSTRQKSYAGKVSGSQKFSIKTPDSTKPGYLRSPSLPSSHLFSAQSPSSMKLSKNKAMNHLPQSETGNETPNQKMDPIKEIFQDRTKLRNVSLQPESAASNIQSNFCEIQPNILMSDGKKMGIKDAHEKVLKTETCENTILTPKIVFDYHENSPQCEQKSNNPQTTIPKRDNNTPVVNKMPHTNDCTFDELQMVSNSRRVISDHVCHRNNTFPALESIIISTDQNKAEEIHHMKRPATAIPIMTTLSTKGLSARDFYSSQSYKYENNFELPRSEKVHIYENNQGIGPSHVVDRSCKSNINLQDQNLEAFYNKTSLPSDINSNQNADTLMNFESQVMGSESNRQPTSNTGESCHKIRNLTFMDPETIWSKGLQFCSNNSSSNSWINQSFSSRLAKSIEKDKDPDEEHHFLSQIEHNPDINLNVLMEYESDFFDNSEVELNKPLLPAEYEGTIVWQNKYIDDNGGYRDRTLGQSFGKGNYTPFYTREYSPKSVNPEMSYQFENSGHIEFLNEALADDMNRINTNLAFTKSNRRYNSYLCPYEIAHNNLSHVPKTPELDNLKDFWTVHHHY